MRPNAVHQVNVVLMGSKIGHTLSFCNFICNSRQGSCAPLLRHGCLIVYVSRHIDGGFLNVVSCRGQIVNNTSYKAVYYRSPLSKGGDNS